MKERGDLQEPGEDEREETSSGKEDEGTIACFAHCGEHVGHCTSYDEVEELDQHVSVCACEAQGNTYPLCGSAESDINTTQSGGGDFRDVDPRDRTPSPLEEASKEVDADKSHVSGWRNIGTLDWGLDANVKANVQHGATHGN